jgi:hypothetical protein
MNDEVIFLKVTSKVIFSAVKNNFIRVLYPQIVETMKKSHTMQNLHVTGAENLSNRTIGRFP